MGLYVWSRTLCKWVKWKGTRAAWLKLPHAHPLLYPCVAAVAAAGLANHFIPPSHTQTQTQHSTPPQPTPLRHPYIPYYGGGTPFWPGAPPSTLVYKIPPGDVPPGIPNSPNSPNSPGTPHNPSPPSQNVPEPASLLLLATAVGMLVYVKRKRRDA